MPREPFNPDRVKLPAEEQFFAAPDKPMSVRDVTAMIKRALAKLPPKLAVEGEISNFSQSPNGHLYFTMKDESACLDCVMWRSDAARMKFKLSDGLAVIAFGQVDVYEPRGRYQLYVTRLLPRGRGELELAFRQLHEKLSRLGWFDQGRKRPIPRIPRTVGLVTSRTGAAIRDVLRTLSIRWPIARVVVADARVQGEGSAESVADGIGRINRHAAALGGVDVLIVARGGGSLEDLWAFNTEIVARAILESAIPVVCGVGHEADTTIADLVADLRVATPTAAAQAVVPDRREIDSRLGAAESTLFRGGRRQLDDLSRRLESCARTDFFRRPASILRTPRQRVDELAGRLAARQRDLLHRLNRSAGELAQRLGRQHPRARLVGQWRGIESLAGRFRWALGRTTLHLERKLGELAFRLRQQSPRVRVDGLIRQADLAAANLRAAAGRLLTRRVQRIESMQRQLAAFDPRAVLGRGYSITTLTQTGELVTRAGQVRPGDRLLTELADGRVESDVAAPSIPSAPGRPRPRNDPGTGEPGRPRPRSRPAARESDLDQLKLFGEGAGDDDGPEQQQGKTGP